MNTDTDFVDATNGPCVFIRSVRTGSVNASAESGTVRIVSARSEGSASNLEKFQNSGADKITTMIHYSTHLSVFYPYLIRISTYYDAVYHKLKTYSFHADHYLQLRQLRFFST